jgi:hypothetical protein
MVEHLIALREWGIGYRRLEELTGVGQATVRRHLSGAYSHVESSLAERVMAVRPTLDGLAPGAQIPIRGVQRRLWALRKIGWNSSDVAGMLGCKRAQIADLLLTDRTKVTVRWHLRVAELYERISMEIPEPTQPRKYVMGLAKRMPGPLDWDDIDFDPAPVRAVAESRKEFVDEMVVDLACSGHRPRRLSHAEVRLVIRVLHSRQFGDPLIAERAGISDREVVRIRKHELGLPPVAYGESVHRRVA